MYRFGEKEAEDLVTMMHSGARNDPVIPPDCSNLLNVASSRGIKDERLKTVAEFGSRLFCQPVQEHGRKHTGCNGSRE